MIIFRERLYDETSPAFGNTVDAKGRTYFTDSARLGDMGKITLPHAGINLVRRALDLSEINHDRLPRRNVIVPSPKDVLLRKGHQSSICWISVPTNLWGASTLLTPHLS
jgi:hypothetical protein